MLAYARLEKYALLESLGPKNLNKALHIHNEKFLAASEESSI